MLIQIIIWLIIGALAGTWARQFLKMKNTSLLRTILLGWVGAFVGGILLSLAGISVEGNGLPGIIINLLVATGGAVLVLWVARLLTR